MKFSGDCILMVFMIGFILVMFCAFLIVAIIYNNKHKKIIENLTKYEIDINAQIDDSIPKLLEFFVQSVFIDYQAKHLVNTQYINSEEEQKIINEVSILCGEQISPAMINKLSLFWKPEKIGAVIADKVYLAVVAYVSNNNAVRNNTNQGD